MSGGTTEDRLRRLDILISERFYDCRVIARTGGLFWTPPGARHVAPLPRWSATWAEAEQVVEGMRSQGWRYECGDLGDGRHWCCLWRGTPYRAEAGTLPEAIAVAALKAVGLTDEEIAHG